MDAFRIEREHGIDVVRFDKPLSLTTAKQAGERLAQAEHPSPRRLFELKARLEMSHDELRSLAEHARSLPNPPLKLALVAEDDLAFAMARMFEVYREDANIQQRVFRDFDDAVAWLNSESS